MEKDGTIISEPFEKAEKLRLQYESVYSDPDEKWKIDDADDFFGVSSNLDQDQDIQEMNQEANQEQRNQERNQERNQKQVCTDCQKEKVHLCLSDLNPRDEMNTARESQVGLPGWSQAVLSNQSVPEDGQSDLGKQFQDDLSDRGQQPQCTMSEERQQVNGQKLEDIFFDYTDVTLAIENISCGASPGPDGVPPCLLKKAKVNIARMLMIIYKSSYEKGDIPDILKLALVSPIHKGGSRSNPAQYRPISLTSHIIKVFERMIRKTLIWYLEFCEKMDKKTTWIKGKEVMPVSTPRTPPRYPGHVGKGGKC